MKTRSPIPDGWRATFFDQADLDASFEALDGARDHFVVDALRGHIRTLQLRFDDAWEYLDRADARSSRSASNASDLIRRLLLEIYRFDNTIAQGPINPRIGSQALGPAPELSGKMLKDSPELEYVLDMWKSCEAKLLLHLGDCERAGKIYARLIAERPGTVSEILCSYYFNLAACQQGLGMTESAQISLENAGLAAGMVRGTLNSAHCAATLYALHHYLGQDSLGQDGLGQDGLEGASLHEGRLHRAEIRQAELDRSDDWLQFLLRLGCPSRTKNLFVERANRLFERCLEHDRLVCF